MHATKNLIQFNSNIFARLSRLRLSRLRLSRLQVHLDVRLHLSQFMGKTEYKSDGSAPQPPEGGWQESNVNSLHGRELVRLIQSGQVTVSVVVCLPFAV